MRYGALVFLISITLLLIAPTPVRACDAWICLGDILGFTELGKNDADRRIQEAEILSAQKTEQSRINADAAVRIKEADERIAAQYQQGLVTIEQARALSEAFRVQTYALRDVKVAELQGVFSTQLQALQGQVAIVTTDRREVEDTKRFRMAMDTIKFLIVFVVIAVYILWRKRSIETSRPALIGSKPEFIQSSWRIVDKEVVR